VTFYAAGNAANGDRTPIGDKIFTAAFSIPGALRLVPGEAFAAPFVSSITAFAWGDFDGDGFPGFIEDQIQRDVQTGLRRRPPIAGEGRQPRPRNGRDRPSGDFPNPVIPGIRDVEIPGRRNGHRHRRVQLRGGGRFAIPAKSTRPTARDRRDVPTAINLPNPMIARIGDVDVARRIHGQATWPIQLCVLSRTTIPAKSGRSRPRDGRDHERIISPLDAADPMVRRIRDEQIPTGVEGEATRRPELRLVRRPIVARESVDSRPHDRCDDPIPTHLANAMILRIRDQNLPLPGHGESRRRS